MPAANTEGARKAFGRRFGPTGRDQFCLPRCGLLVMKIAAARRSPPRSYTPSVTSSRPPSSRPEYRRWTEGDRKVEPTDQFRPPHWRSIGYEHVHMDAPHSRESGAFRIGKAHGRRSEGGLGRQESVRSRFLLATRCLEFGRASHRPREPMVEAAFEWSWSRFGVGLRVQKADGRRPPAKLERVSHGG